jgi:hypothetical protein
MSKKYRKLKQLKEFAKSYKHSNENSKKNILNSKEGIANVTDTACIRPDIFLNNGRYCFNCPYYDHCNCGIKRLTNIKKSNKIAA